MQRQKGSLVISLGLVGVCLVGSVYLWGCGLFNPCGNGVLDKGESCEGTIEQACQTACNTKGKQVCNPKACQWQSCISTEEELCNGKDDDCDGATDEGFECAVGSGKPCQTTCGTQGSFVCNSSCQWETTCTPPREICGNGIDDDCNGLTDQFGVIGDKIEIAKGFCDRGKPAIAWTGKDYGIVWNTQCRPTARLYFLRVSKEGKPLTDLVQLDVGELPFTSSPSIVWNGYGFNIALPQESKSGEMHYLLMLEVDINGRVVRSEKINSASFVYIAPYLTMVWRGNAAIAAIKTFDDKRKRAFEFFVVSAEGKKAGPSSSFVIEGSTGLAVERSLAWSDNSFGFIWQDSDEKVYFNKIDGFPDQLNVSPPTRLPFHGSHFNIAWSGQQFGVVWTSDLADKSVTAHGTVQTSFDELYFSLLSANGEVSLDSIQVTKSKGYASIPSFVWTGKEYALAWIDGRDGGVNPAPSTDDSEDQVPEPGPLPFREIYFTRLSSNGEPVGNEMRISHSRGHSYDAVLSWADEEYSVFWIDFSEKYRFLFNGELKGSLYFNRVWCQ